MLDTKLKILRAGTGDYCCCSFANSPEITILPIRPGFRPVMVGVRGDATVRDIEDPANGVIFFMYISRSGGGLPIYYDGSSYYYAILCDRPLTTRDKAIIDRALGKINNNELRTPKDRGWLETMFTGDE